MNNSRFSFIKKNDTLYSEIEMAARIGQQKGENS